MKTYKAVAFDLDGTLLNTLEDLKEALNYTMSAMNCPLRTLDETRNFVGNGIRKLLERALPEGKRGEEYVSRAYEIFCDYYAQHDADCTVPYDGICSLLEKLSVRGVRLAVISNKADFAVRALCKRFFGDIFAVVIGAGDALPHKPDPTGLFAAMREMNVSPEDTVYVGDSDVDCYTAKNAEVDCISVSWGFRPRALLSSLHPLAVVDSAAQLQKILLGE